MMLRKISTALIGGFFFSTIALSQEPPAKPVAAEAQELTRGPIHEAFGQPIQFDPAPGPVIPKAPPAPVDEIPPDQKPEGENVGWIPGYWAWDEDAKDFLWVSGFWRTLPPDRKWVPGYWTKVEGGYQYVSGFWAPEKATEVEYLPTPPESLENGPQTEAAEGQIWVSGVWVWRDGRFWWRPGYWATVNPDWVWVPAHYVWTPNGYVFIEGYWDYPLVHRGLLFAPVTFASVRPGFVYTPSVVLDIRYLVDTLFVCPRFCGYHFGDYYDSRYVKAGYYPWFAYHNSRYGYDPLLAHTRQTLTRTDAQWEQRVRANYYQRVENTSARPPHTYREYSEWARKAVAERRDVQPIARPLREVPTTRDFGVRLERVNEKQSAVIRNQAKQVQEFREKRLKVEQDGASKLPPVKATDPTAPKVIQRHEPDKVKLPDVPHLGPPAGTKLPQAKPLPEPPRLPDVHPKMTPPTTRGTTPARTLPPPEDIIRDQHPKATPMPKVTPPPKAPPKKGKDKGKDG
jgi:hypothetical protein